jgi:hypothetical protein
MHARLTLAAVCALASCACFAASGITAVRVATASPGGASGELHYKRLPDGLTLSSAADVEAGIVPKGRFVPVYP